MADIVSGTLDERIKELGDKSTQILLFLSFTIVAVATLETISGLDSAQKTALRLAMKWWIRAFYPVLLGIVPLKELRENNLRWYQIIRWSKFILLWTAALLIFLGIFHFIRALS